MFEANGSVSSYVVSAERGRESCRKSFVEMTSISPVFVCSINCYLVDTHGALPDVGDLREINPALLFLFADGLDDLLDFFISNAGLDERLSLIFSGSDTSPSDLDASCGRGGGLDFGGSGSAFCAWTGLGSTETDRFVMMGGGFGRG